MNHQLFSALIVVVYITVIIIWIGYDEFPANEVALNEAKELASVNSKTSRLLNAYLVKNPTPKVKELRHVNRQIKEITEVQRVCEEAKNVVTILE